MPGRTGRFGTVAGGMGFLVGRLWRVRQDRGENSYWRKERRPGGNGNFRPHRRRTDQRRQRHVIEGGSVERVNRGRPLRGERQLTITPYPPLTFSVTADDKGVTNCQGTSFDSLKTRLVLRCSTIDSQELSGTVPYHRTF